MNKMIVGGLVGLVGGMLALPVTVEVAMQIKDNILPALTNFDALSFQMYGWDALRDLYGTMPQGAYLFGASALVGAWAGAAISTVNDPAPAPKDTP